MASRASNKSCSATAAVELADLHVRLVALAHAGDWSELAVTMQHRDALLGAVTVSERAVVFTAAMRCNDLVSGLVCAARQGIVDQLRTLRRGRDMSGRYEAHRAAVNTAA